MSGHYVPQTMSSENGMFTEAEETKLQTFLNNLETVDTDVQLEKKNETTSKRKSEKKRTTPYQKKGKSPKGRARKQPHELLSEEQKKANHIASEQKRRANIRVGFDQLVNIVPTLDSYHRSESVILQKCNFVHVHECL
ncbi:uncharacterized protein BX663DRAFT_504969 [Cokeromyces recurvatus]|uniref:uncharacterized protein n=1 Tax=Cokeromyces recurvatus TaxID=90255 RepID=UPI00221F3BF1|nr:uncharacterized protein BX663DRAFT_504969 [Cokeromyces recurvatus]KAI7904410.1 hypothetical protein BX663DRAFT_504969 [Cokeromyces recurvatus]